MKKQKPLKKIIAWRNFEYEVKNWEVEMGSEEIDISGKSLPSVETGIFINKIMIEIGRKKPKKKKRVKRK